MSFVDIDECTANTDNCDDDDRAVCTNTNGGFICTCKQGFTGDGISCTGFIVKYRPINSKKKETHQIGCQ
jgi:hypothetical protein